MQKRLLTLALAGALLAVGTAARAADEQQPPKAQIEFRPVGAGTGLTAWGIIAWAGFGLGARYEMPLIPSGLLHGSVPAFKKDSVEVEAGADFVRYDAGLWWADVNYNVFRPAVGGKWSLWLTDEIAVYPKVELGFDISWWSGYDWPTGYDPPNHTGIYFDAAAGALYKLGTNLTLRAEVGIDGLRAGVGYRF